MDTTIPKQCEIAARLLKSLANAKRLEILCAIWQQEMKVGDLEAAVQLSQSALSQHLAKLRQEKIVTTRRDAQTIYYTLASDDVRKVMETLHILYAPCYADRGVRVSSENVSKT